MLFYYIFLSISLYFGKDSTRSQHSAVTGPFLRSCSTGPLVLWAGAEGDALAERGASCLPSSASHLPCKRVLLDSRSREGLPCPAHLWQEAQRMKPWDSFSFSISLSELCFCCSLCKGFKIVNKSVFISSFFPTIPTSFSSCVPALCQRTPVSPHQMFKSENNGKSKIHF